MAPNLRCIALLSIVAITSGCMSSTPTLSAQSGATVSDGSLSIVEGTELTREQQARYDEALASLQQGHHADGIAMLIELIAAAPGFAALHIDVATAYRENGDFEAAWTQLQAALQINPQHIVALNELGVVQRHRGRFEEARIAYESALAIHPDFHYALRNLGVLCDLYLEDLDCASDYYQRYLATGVTDSEASMWLQDVTRRRNGGM